MGYFNNFENRIESTIYRTKERLDKILSNMGYGSMKDVQKIIKEGRVEVNSHIINKKDFKLDPYEDIVTLDGYRVL